MAFDHVGNVRLILAGAWRYVTRMVWAIIASVVLIVLWVAWASHSHQIAFFFNGDAETSNAGTWGDSFGPFNGLVGALGFAVVVATLIVQGRALAAQQVDQHRQRFETTFFQLLALMRELRSDLTYRHSKEYRTEVGAEVNTGTLEGIEAVAGALKELDHWRVWQELEGVPLSAGELADVYYAKIHSRFERNFGPYFRIVHTILTRIQNDKVLPPEEKVVLANIFRSQLTSDEIELAAFNALMPAANNLFELLTEFKMLKYLPDAKIKKILERYYDDSAFEGRDEGDVGASRSLQTKRSPG